MRKLYSLLDANGNAVFQSPPLGYKWIVIEAGFKVKTGTTAVTVPTRAAIVHDPPASSTIIYNDGDSQLTALATMDTTTRNIKAFAFGNLTGSRIDVQPSDQPSTQGITIPPNYTIKNGEGGLLFVSTLNVGDTLIGAYAVVDERELQ